MIQDWSHGPVSGRGGDDRSPALGPSGHRPRVQRSRDRVLADLTAAGRLALERDGVAGLSLRAVAREVGLGSSGVYRYIENRDGLVRLLLAQVSAEMGDVADHADRACAGRGGDPADRWLEVARGVRDWARAYPQPFVLMCSTNHALPGDLPGQRGANAFWRVLGRIVDTARSTGALHPSRVTLNDDGIFDTARFPSGELPTQPFADLALRAVSLYTSLLGAVITDVFSHVDHSAGARDRLFDLLVAAGAETAGLEISTSPTGDPDSSDDHRVRGSR